MADDGFLFVAHECNFLTIQMLYNCDLLLIQLQFLWIQLPYYTSATSLLYKGHWMQLHFYKSAMTEMERGGDGVMIEMNQRWKWSEQLRRERWSFVTD